MKLLLIKQLIYLPFLSILSLPIAWWQIISDEGISRLPEVMHEYIQAYMKLWQDAKPIAEKPEGDFYLRKKEATRALMKRNDPGFPIMASIFGEEKTRKVFDLVF